MTEKNRKSSRGKPVSGRGAKRPQRAVLAADRIKETARNLFYREGIRAVGVDKIVTEAGVTKPSLYRSFPSKDELAVSYLRDYSGEFWKRLDTAIAKHPGDPRAQILDYLRGLGERAQHRRYRGCGISNAAVEYPEHDHPAHVFAEEHKQELRARLTAMAGEMGAAKPAVLADGLLLLLEGTFLCGQLFGSGGPSASAAEIADRLIEASLKS
jgi:AcrR family transcriptional regulator